MSVFKNILCDLILYIAATSKTMNLAALGEIQTQNLLSFFSIKNHLLFCHAVDTTLKCP